MKSNLVLLLVILLGIVLLAGAGVLWHLSDTTEFSRTTPAPTRLSP